jgi:hypothetical protein
MIHISCYLISNNDLQVGFFKNEYDAKKWIIKILNDNNYLEQWWTGNENIEGFENIYQEIKEMDIIELINGLEYPGDIKINMTYQIQDKL